MKNNRYLVAGFGVLLAPFGGVAIAMADESKCPTYDSFDERNDYLSSSFQWENDIGNSDRWYTNGMKYSRTLNPICNKGYPGLDNFVQNTMSQDSKNKIFLTSWLIGMNMYTPVKIGFAGPQPYDRPWSGWAYFGRNWQLNDITETKIGDRSGNYRYSVGVKQKFEVQLGALGDKAQQDRVQRAWHALVGAQYPAGWENQKDGKYGYSLAYTYQWNHIPESMQNVGFNLRGGGTAGNVVQQGIVGAGISWDLNNFEMDDATYLPIASLSSLPQITPTIMNMISSNPSPSDSTYTDKQFHSSKPIYIASLDNTYAEGLNDDATSRKQDDAATSMKPDDAKLNKAMKKWYKSFNVTVFGDIELKHLFSNYFLQGTKVQMKPNIWDAKLGVAWKVKNSDLTVRLSHVNRGQEFSVPGMGDAQIQRFTQFSFEWNWGFVKNPISQPSP